MIKTVTIDLTYGDEFTRANGHVLVRDNGIIYRSAGTDVDIYSSFEIEDVALVGGRDLDALIWEIIMPRRTSFHGYLDG